MKKETESFYYKAEIIEIVIYCISDVVAALYKGEGLPLERPILYLMDSIYIGLPLLMAVTWAKYLEIRMTRYGYKPKRMDSIIKIGCLVMFVVTMTSPFTKFGFTLDEQNGYHRGVGSYLVPVLAYCYFLYDSIVAFRFGRKTNQLAVRKEFMSLMMFSIPGIIFSALQLVFYGITATQVGFTIGFLLVHILRTQGKISTDGLTSLGNRSQLDKTLDSLSRNESEIMVCMIDVNKFKSINDEFGHLEGDQALKNVATAIIKGTATLQKKGDSFENFRYGGDEFLIISKYFRRQSIDELKMEIRNELSHFNSDPDKKFELSISMGFTTGKISNQLSAKQIIDEADDNMYIDKKAYKETH